MTQIKVFNHEMFGSVRTMTNEKGETFFVGKDVAKALGYKDTSDAMKRHVDTEDKLSRRITDSGQRRRVILINESGLYALILSSKLKEAKAFKRWVTSEVLPQIRMTGGYIPTRDADGRELTSEEILARAEQIVGKMLSLLNAPGKDCLTATEVARTWGMDVKSFNSLLERLGVQHRAQGRWQLAKQLADRGLAQVRHFFYYSLNGEQKSHSYMVWSPEGVRFLNSLCMAEVVKGPEIVQLNMFVN